MTQPEPPRTSPRVSDAEAGRPLANGLIVGGIVALFVLAAIAVWAWWSADEKSAADNSRDQIVQPSELPAPGNGAVAARPNNDSAVDATGNASEGSSRVAPAPAPAPGTRP